ncbi:ethanolamine utilization protein EutN [Natronincola peptidivorans]|uniref:Ethanolamine utilization protein EutN n=1 Tax=Natronincola peptidivorans TaxID=426128 RepID=A0A1I0CZ12_9FIRM|nr:EutN/CcmL family microcompartment protein [Natronincola peptidivorans]SET24871.1 ethanolamine utilization protein EutN [Natronincola peptidivorans]
MILGKVIGTVVSTRKNDKLRGSKFSIVKPLDLHGPQQSLVAVDNIGAGIGEIVLMVTGSAARIAVDNLDAPVDAAVIGIVDSEDYIDIAEV